MLTRIYGISSYGADYDVEGLVKRLKRKDIFIPPFPQLTQIWKKYSSESRSMYIPLACTVSIDLSSSFKA